MIECESEKSASFFMYNFGNSDIHFLLSYKQISFDKTPYDWIHFEPKSGTIVPGDSVEITVRIKPLDSGVFTVQSDFHS